MQLYGTFDPASLQDCTRIKHCIEQRLAEVHILMLKNMLKINDNKMELIVFSNQTTKTSAECQSLLSSITLADCNITATSTVRNLGVVLDNCLDGSSQVSAMVKACNYHLFQIARIRHYISDESCKLAVLALVISRLDYCNSLLAAVTSKQVQKLQNIQDHAASWTSSPTTWTPRAVPSHYPDPTAAALAAY